MKWIGTIERMRDASRGTKTVVTFAALAALFPIVSNAAVLQWDADLNTPGAQGGDGRAGTAFFGPEPPPLTGGWWDGAQNVPWVQGSDVVFGGAPGRVMVPGLRFNSITFSSQYELDVDPPFFQNVFPFELDAGVVNVGSGLTVSLSNRDRVRYYVLNEFIKEGPGTLIVEQIRRVSVGFGPPVVINEGTLATSGILSAGSPSLTIGPSGTLKVMSSGVVLPPLWGSGTVQLDAVLTLGDISNFAGTFRGTGGLMIRNSSLPSGEHEFTGMATIASPVQLSTLANAGMKSPLGAGDTIGLAGPLTISSSEPVSTNRKIALAGGTIVTPDPGSLVTVSGLVEGAGSLGKSGPGTLRLENSGNSIPTIVVEEGALVSRFSDPISGPNGKLVLGAEDKQGQLIIPAGINDETRKNIELVGGGGKLSIADSTVTLKGTISGWVPLTLSGNGADSSVALIAPGSSSSTNGNLLLEHLTVRVLDANGISDHAGVEFVHNTGARLLIAQGDTIGHLSGGGGANPGRVDVTGTLVLSGGQGSENEFSGIILGSGSLEKSNRYSTQILTGQNAFEGDVWVSGGVLAVPRVANRSLASPLGSGNTVRLGSDGSNALQPVLRITASESTTSNRVLALTAAGGEVDVVNAAGTVIWSGEVNGDLSAQLKKTGAGTLRLTGANGFLGAVQVNGGRLQVFGGNALPNYGNVSVAAGASLEVLFGTSETIGSLEGNGDLALGSRLITGLNDRSTTFSGRISGTGDAFLEKRGSGTFTLSNRTSDFSNGVRILDGAVSVPALNKGGAVSALGKAGQFSLGDGDSIGRLIVTESGRMETDRGFSIMQGGGAIEVGSAEGNLVLTGPLEGSSTLLKLGAGRLALANEKTFSGIIVVADGTLELAGDISSDVWVHEPGVLETSGEGARSIAALTLDSGRLAIGGRELSGALDTGDLVLRNGEFAFDLQAASHDHLMVTGSVLLNGPVTLTINLEVDPEDFVGEYRLVLNDGTDVTTVFDNASRFVYQGNVLEEGETFLATTGEISQYFVMHYGITEDDNDVRLVVAPEPGSAGMLLAGALCLSGWRKRRKAA